MKKREANKKPRKQKKTLKKGEKEGGGQATKARHAETGTDFDLVRKKKRRGIYSRR